MLKTCDTAVFYHRTETINYTGKKELVHYVYKERKFLRRTCHASDTLCNQFSYIFCLHDIPLPQVLFFHQTNASREHS